MADSFTDRRASVGIKLFRSMLVSNTTYLNKVTHSGELHVKLIFIVSDRKARALAASLGPDFQVLKGKPVVLEVVSLNEYLKSKETILGAFIVQKMNGANLKAVIDKSILDQTLLFSPFEGDVEKGVLGGISVESKVRPFINIDTLKKSKITLKDFYLRVSKKHEAQHEN
ncbi:MAG: hypothetical protein MJK04_01695 [Psychrosphaera sp.]|nr:hypothetical protein [Psychrosphaera sp.]